MQGTLSVTINSGSSVSPDIDLRKGKLAAIFVPTITSGDMFVQGCFDTTSANFVRIQRPPLIANSGDLRFATGVGSLMLIWPSDYPTPPYLRLETAVNQGANRTFTVRFGPA